MLHLLIAAASYAGRPASYAGRAPTVGCLRSAPLMTEVDITPKDQLMSVLFDGLRTPSDLQAEVNEIILKAERINPTSAPAQSPLLNGVWTLKYAAGLAPGLVDSPTRAIALSIYSSFSAGGLRGLLDALPFESSLDDATVSITSLEAGQPRVTTQASVKLFGEARTFKFSSNLQPLSGVRLREIFVEGEVFGFRSLVPGEPLPSPALHVPLLPSLCWPLARAGPLSLSRQLFVTYLDEEMAILRDEVSPSPPSPHALATCLCARAVVPPLLVGAGCSVPARAPQSGVPEVLLRKEAFVGAAEPEGDDSPD